MPKVTFTGAGSSIFVRNIIGDSYLRDSLKDMDIALYDIDPVRLEESKFILSGLNKSMNDNRATIKTYLGVENRKEALRGADFVVNAIQVGGYKPSTVVDFEVPKKYGLRQTIGDTLGIGGIFRALRTIPVVMDFARDIEEVAPKAWFLNYSNPMAMLTGALLRYSDVKTVGLCHSVQIVGSRLLSTLGLDAPLLDEGNLTTFVAGINHMAWLLKFEKDGKDLYPEIKRLAAEKLAEWRKEPDKAKKSGNMARLELMLRFGYYITESSEHLSEYVPWFIKSRLPELIDEWNIPLDEYPRRCIRNAERWHKAFDDIKNDPNFKHEKSKEYGAGIMDAIVSGKPYQFGGNVLNHGLITNLPHDCVVEVPCLANANGIAGTYVGDLPQQCAALNRTNINVQMMTIEAAMTRKKEAIYQAAMLDPHTAAELSIDEIIHLCDDLIEAHGNWLPKFN